MPRITLDGLDITYAYQPACGDGWNDEHFAECVLVEQVTLDGVDVTDEYDSLDDIGEMILNILGEV